MFVFLFLVHFISKKKNKYKEKIPAHLFVCALVWPHPPTYNFPNDHGFNGYSFLELIDMNKQSWDRLSAMFCFFLCGLWYKISSMLVGESDYYTMASHQKLINWKKKAMIYASLTLHNSQHCISDFCYYLLVRPLLLKYSNPSTSCASMYHHA